MSIYSIGVKYINSVGIIMTEKCIKWSNYYLYIHMKTAKKWFMHWSHFLGWLRHNFKLCEVIKINIRGRHHSTVVIIMTEKSMTWANLYFIYTYDDLKKMDPVLITVLVLVRTKHQFDCAIFHSCTVGSYKCQYKRQTP